MSAARVVVTGGSGFLGSHLVERLAAAGDDVTIVDLDPPSRWLPEAVRQARQVRGDVRDPTCLGQAIRPGVDVIYHLAAVVGVDQYLSRPVDVIDINFAATRNVLDLAARAEARIVVASTSEVFGKNPEVPWREDSDRVLGPTSADRWAYSSAKALAEHLTLAFARQRGLAATIVRFFNAYGPRQRPAYVISRSIHRALNNRPMVVYDQGRQTRSFTYVDDAVTGMVLAGRCPAAAGETFNIGSSTETTVNEAVAMIARLTGAEPPLAVDTRDRLGSPYEDLPRRVPDSSKAWRMLGWQSQVQLPDGLARTVEWARRSPWWLARPDRGVA